MQPKRSIDRIALLAIIAAMLSIIWAKIEIHGTHEIERFLSEDQSPLPAHCDARRVEAVTRNRWAGGLIQ